MFFVSFKDFVIKNVFTSSSSFSLFSRDIKLLACDCLSRDLDATRFIYIFKFCKGFHGRSNF